MATSTRRPRLLDLRIRQLGQDLIGTASIENEEKLQRFREDPMEWWATHRGFAPETLKWSLLPEYKDHQWDGTPDPLWVIFKGLADGHRRIGVESGVATGKTFLLARVTEWFLECWRSVVISIAPKEKQLKLNMWKEITKEWPTFKRLHPRAEKNDLRIQMDGTDAWAAHGISVGVGADEESATKAQGFHEEHQLFIIEETPGVHSATITAAINTNVDEHNIILAVGNPDHQLDPLHDFCVKIATLTVRISAKDHPNVVTGRRIIRGAVTRASIEEKRKRYGEESPLFRSRVRGISPAESTDALIRLSWCYQARDRGRELAERLFPDSENPDLRRILQNDFKSDHWKFNNQVALGQDVANSKDGDRAASARGRGPVLCEIEAYPCPDANALGRQVALEIRSRGMDPDFVGVDGVGVGAGTVNELIDQDLIVQNLNGSAAMVLWLEPLGEEEFKNLRSQMYWLLREDLQHGRIILPDDEELFQDLITPLWTTKGGKITVESKEDLKKRLGRSPDKGDAVVYWNWVRQVRMGSSGGGVMIDL